MRSDLALNGQIMHPDRLMDQALLWLQEEEVIRLNKGPGRVPAGHDHPAQAGDPGVTQADFTSLQLHYDERVRQIHMMAEYAQHGLRPTADHMNLAMDYFSLSEDLFLERWPPDRYRELSRQTTPQSWRAIATVAHASIRLQRFRRGYSRRRGYAPP